MSKFWQHFLQNGAPSPQRGYLGLHGYGIPIKRRLAGRFDLEQATGVAVQAIEPYSPAEDAGILEGDVVVRLDGQPTTTADDLNKMLGKLPIDIPVSIVLIREERILERLVMTASGPRSTRRRA